MDSLTDHLKTEDPKGLEHDEMRKFSAKLKLYERQGGQVHFREVGVFLLSTVMEYGRNVQVVHDETVDLNQNLIGSFKKKRERKRKTATVEGFGKIEAGLAKAKGINMSKDGKRNGKRFFFQNAPEAIQQGRFINPPLANKIELHPTAMTPLG